MLPFRKPGAGVPLYPVMPLVGTPLILGNGAGEYVPPAETIDAPTSVTYIDGTNPPSFFMNVTEAGPGAVEVGDTPYKRYNGAGTEYAGDPIDAIPLTQPLGGFGDSPLSDGATGYVQYKFDRGGGVVSDWSSASEGAYEIALAGAPDAFTILMWDVDDLATGGAVEVTASSLPSDNGSAITAIQYRVDGGTWTNSGIDDVGTFQITGLTDDVEVAVELRAVNAEGNGPDSDDKTVTPTTESDPATVALADRGVMSGTTSFTFTGKTLGLDSIIVVFVSGGSLSSTSATLGVTANGVTASAQGAVIRHNSAIQGQVFSVAPGATSGDVVVTCSIAAERCMISIFSASDLISLTATDTFGTNSNVDPATANVDVDAGGFIIGSMYTFGDLTPAFTGMDIDYSEHGSSPAIAYGTWIIGSREYASASPNQAVSSVAPGVGSQVFLGASFR